VTPRVQFVGAVAHAQVPEQLHSFDIFAAASRLDSESFGVAVIEASACGLPVVVTRAGGLPEVVRRGETGLVVERENPAALAEALQRLIDDPTLRARLGAAGRAHVQACYEWDTSVQTMIDVYRQALRVSSLGRLPAGQVR
jgi:glycosyltransferase involved in cell wall biosynthesis